MQNMKFRIGYRTLKTAVGTGLAIFIAQLLSLDNFVSAGILTILCVKSSTRQSVQSAWSRLVACMIAMGFSFIFFELIGYNPASIGLLLLFFIPTTVLLKVSEGIVTSSVIILHIYSFGEVTWRIILNETGIILTGIGVALIANLYMPSLDRQLKTYQRQIEDNFKKILGEMASYLQKNESQWLGQEITETANILAKAKSLSFRDVENHFRRTENYYYHYFKTREKQFEIMERILPVVTSIEPMVEQRHMIGAFMEELSLSIHPGNTAKLFLLKLESLAKEFRKMPLPQTREEFEARAQLYRFMKEMEQYLIAKESLKVDI
jgi:uncharacterized membrane protein YgaE (UPF0421/DUF939 family)